MKNSIGPFGYALSGVGLGAFLGLLNALVFIALPAWMSADRSYVGGGTHLALYLLPQFLLGGSVAGLAFVVIAIGISRMMSSPRWTAVFTGLTCLIVSLTATLLILPDVLAVWAMPSCILGAILASVTVIRLPLQTPAPRG